MHARVHLFLSRSLCLVELEGVDEGYMGINACTLSHLTGSLEECVNDWCRAGGRGGLALI